MRPLPPRKKHGTQWALAFARSTFCPRVCYSGSSPSDSESCWFRVGLRMGEGSPSFFKCTMRYCFLQSPYRITAHRNFLAPVPMDQCSPLPLNCVCSSQPLITTTTLRSTPMRWASLDFIRMPSGGTNPSVPGLLHLVIASSRHIVTNYRTSFLFLVYYTYTILSLTIHSVMDTWALATSGIVTVYTRVQLSPGHICAIPFGSRQSSWILGSSSFNLRGTSELFSSMAINVEFLKHVYGVQVGLGCKGACSPHLVA